MPETPAKKALGQHWLEDAASLEAMCDAAEVQMDDQVLEIGPGKGSLTRRLLARDAEVLAIEYDGSLARALRQNFLNDADARIRVEEADIRTYDFGTLPPDYKIVANIPYYLSAYLFRLLTETPNKPTVAALLVQKEVAERVCALPGQMSLLSVVMQYYYQCDLGPVVPARLFTPPPKVDSQVLQLLRRSELLFDGVVEKDYFRLVKAGFSNRRKTLLNSLAAGLRRDKTDIQEKLQRAGLRPMSRPQELGMGQWYQLYRTMFP